MRGRIGLKVSDYIVEYLIQKGITDVFGYPGGMVTHLMDSFRKYDGQIKAHVTYHEQGAAFAACGYAQASNKVGIAYATSGPGATNLITGICNAYFDSVPVLFITGQVNTFEAKGNLDVRQKGFQETDIVAMISGVTKYAVRIEKAEEIKWHLDYAFTEATDRRKGPVLLDIPMDIFRTEIEPAKLKGYEKEKDTAQVDCTELINLLNTSKRPVIVAGNGIRQANAVKEFNQFISKMNIPVVSTMPAIDIVHDKDLYYGFVGAYGHRTANFIIAKSDLVITMGARLDVRQVGAIRNTFASDAKIIRIDIDKSELQYRVHDDEVQMCADIRNVLESLNCYLLSKQYEKWIRICQLIKDKLQGIDDKIPNIYMKMLGECIPDGVIITTDVGQNQVWVAQSLEVKQNQRVLFSGGHGAMGYSLPAAIGCALATNKTVYSFSGDGGIQMNIQELQTIAREWLPIKIIVFNNLALGMIRHFQEMYFEKKYYQTIAGYGYDAPDFKALAGAYKIPYCVIKSAEDIGAEIFSTNGPQFIEVKIKEPTYVFPKVRFGKLNQDQEPLIERKMYEEIMGLSEADLIPEKE